MIIILRKDDLLWSLFPDVDPNDNSSILKGLENYYTYENVKPTIQLENDLITINIHTEEIEAQNKEYQEAIQYCNKGNYGKAKSILDNLIRKNRTNSEYYRNYGQILSEEGNQDEAINYLISALKWNPKNVYALIMMGNIFMRYKKDLDTALKYYNKALYINPNDHLTLNNIGVILIEQNNRIGAKKYFEKAYSIESKYPNTIYALAMICEQEANYKEAFEKCIEIFKVSENKNDIIVNNALNLALDICKKLEHDDEIKNNVMGYRAVLEERGGKEIEIKQDTSIKTAAKLEYAELYNRKEHLVKYNNKLPSYYHLVLHELLHLEFALDAREEHKQQVFLVNPEQRNKYINKIKTEFKALKKLGFNDYKIRDHINYLFDGINNQLYNTPIDLFIENKINIEFERIRPLQFYSMYTFLQEGIRGVTQKNVTQVVPDEIITMNKIYNLVSAFQFNEFYGIDLISKFKANAKEYKTARKFYYDYTTLQENKKPGDEYQLIVDWANVFNWLQYFELVNEEDYFDKRVNIENVISEFESFDETKLKPDLQKEKEMQTFLETQKEIGLNMAVVMFMVDALKYFKDKDKEEIKRIAFEIAMQGTQGYKPEKKDYRLNLVPNKQFSGYHILAYYYVSFAMVLPELLEQLQLPYGKEYELALQLYNKV